MLFNSLHFLIFFPIVLILFSLAPERFQRAMLLVASYYFYMSWNPTYIILIVACTLTAYVFGRLIGDMPDKEDTSSIRKRKALLGAGVSLAFLPLLFFKYAGFIVNNLFSVLSLIRLQTSAPHIDLLLPVGISFFTFQAVGYVIDVYRGDIPAEKDLILFALFVSFFPQLVAGPIERSRNLLGQLRVLPRHISYDRFREGLLLMLWGYFCKLVLADRAAVFVDACFEPEASVGGAAVLLGLFLFSFQIYGDFAGYSMIAAGASMMVGVHLMDNFYSPYLATSVRDFWRRWHISLSSWFRDYLYKPLGGGAHGTRARYRNTMITFLLSGLWHGASWHFVAWGGINGLLQVVGSATEKLRNSLRDRFSIPSDSVAARGIRTFCTVVLIDFAWLFFRAPSLRYAFRYLHSIVSDFRAEQVSGEALYAFGLDRQNLHLLFAAILLLMITDYQKNRGVVVRQTILAQEAWVRCAVYAIGIVVVLVFGVWGAAYDAQSFLYFQF